ncbi:hypothetical protein ACFLZG_08090 [Thermodesulfobacteriota bacterium]
MSNEKRSEEKINAVAIVSVIAVIFLASALVVGVWSAGEMREGVVRQFNEEKQVIAHGVSKIIERELTFLRKEIFLLGDEISKEGSGLAEQNEVSQIKNSF